MSDEPRDAPHINQIRERDKSISTASESRATSGRLTKFLSSATSAVTYPSSSVYTRFKDGTHLTPSSSELAAANYKSSGHTMIHEGGGGVVCGAVFVRVVHLRNDFRYMALPQQGCTRTL